MQEPIETKIVKSIADARKNRFWGTFEIMFRNGVPTVLKITETEMLEPERKTLYESRTTFQNR